METTETKLKTCRGKSVLPFMKYKWPFIVISLFFMVLSVQQILVKGFNYGVDFKGGSKLVYEFETGVDSQQVRDVTESLGLGDVQVIEFGVNAAAPQYMLRAKYLEGQDVPNLIDAALVEKFGLDKVHRLSEETVGPKVGADLQKKGILSIVFTCVLILVYVGFRFDFLFAPGGVIALIHDVLISAGFFAWFGKEFNLPILAALLTILGYSINDTVVIYDRIRENVAKLPKKTAVADIIDVSLTETLSRTIVTSLTVLMVVVVLFYLGGGVLHDFAFCLIIGVIFGSYSSIFIASPVYVFLHKFFPHYGIKVSEPDQAKAA